MNKETTEWVDSKTNVISTPTIVYKTVTFVCSGCPPELFKEWKETCQKKFNDIYWAKLWSDHVKASAFDSLMEGKAQMVIEKQGEPTGNKEEEIHLIGDGGEENE